MMGITTTVPLEILLAAGRRTLDLNNLFITDPSPHMLIARAERDGFPRNSCNWIKGLYSTALREGIEEMIAVSEGDCSNSKALMAVLRFKGVASYQFGYPADRQRASLQAELDRLAAHVGASPAAIRRAQEQLHAIRRQVHEIDRLTWETQQVRGDENHYYQVCTSDMNGDPDSFAAEVDRFVAEARQRAPLADALRLGYIGVPPIFTDLYPTLEAQGARVVFNEVQRQFSMPGPVVDLAEQYLRYTYPYDIDARLEDIDREIRRRKLQGIIHYVQSFCFRQIEDIVIRSRLKVPVLTLEGDQPGPLDARSRIRLESFVCMLKGQDA